MRITPLGRQDMKLSKLSGIGPMNTTLASAQWPSRMKRFAVTPELRFG